MSSAKETKTAHLPRADRDETFCGLPLTTGLWLVNKIEAADCDVCIQAAIEEGATIVDRRDAGPNKLAEILSAVFGRPVEQVELEITLRPDISRVMDHFLPHHAELKNVPRELLDEQFLDLPSYALSKDGWFPTPEAMVMSMLSFYLDAVNISVKAGDVPLEQGHDRLNRVRKLTEYCIQMRSDSDRKQEYPITVDQWPAVIREAHS